MKLNKTDIRQKYILQYMSKDKRPYPQFLGQYIDTNIIYNIEL